MEIFIQQTNTILPDGRTPDGYSITMVNRTGKRSFNDNDFFEDGSEIAQKVLQLKRLLKIHFDAQV